MGFEAALAFVIPEHGEFTDYEKSDNPDTDDIFFDDRVRVKVPARIWRVFKWLDFGGVRTIVKSSSSLTPEERAAGTFDERAAKCVAAHLLNMLFPYEAKVAGGQHEFAVPFIADHYMEAAGLSGDSGHERSFRKVFEKLGAAEAVRGMRTIDHRRRDITKELIESGALWEHNRLLLEGDIAMATSLTSLLYESPCGLVWIEVRTITEMLCDLLLDGGIEGRELRKDSRSTALVRSWIDQLAHFIPLCVRAIMVTGYFHSDAAHAIRSQRMFL